MNNISFCVSEVWRERTVIIFDCDGGGGRTDCNHINQIGIVVETDGSYDVLLAGDVVNSSATDAGPRHGLPFQEECTASSRSSCIFQS